MKKILAVSLLVFCLLLGACAKEKTIAPTVPQSASKEITTEQTVWNTTEATQTVEIGELCLAHPKSEGFDLAQVPAYSGSPYTVIHENVPYFPRTELPTVSMEYYGDLDALGRCTLTYAVIGTDLMPTEDRGSIGSVKPTGWQTVKYDEVDGGYLYNRCHLIGYQLSGENANNKNLITGTRYLNVEGMLPFENMVADYVKETENHVVYRVTPIFADEFLLAFGVLMEAYSVEDDGEGICLNVFCYNVQPGVELTYESGESCRAEVPTETTTEGGTRYIVNTNTKRFHLPSCSSVEQINNKYKQEFIGSREELLAQGYTPCGSCHP